MAQGQHERKGKFFCLLKEKVSKWCRKKLKLLLLKSLIEENLFYVKLQIQANWENVKSELFCAKLND